MFFNFSSYHLFVILEVVVVVCELIYLLCTCLNILNGRSIDIDDDDDSDEEEDIIEEYFQDIDDENESLLLPPNTEYLQYDNNDDNNNNKEYIFPKDFVLQNFLNHMKVSNCCSICLETNADNISLCCGSNE
jgi:hypothetical protein